MRLLPESAGGRRRPPRRWPRRPPERSRPRSPTPLPTVPLGSFGGPVRGGEPGPASPRESVGLAFHDQRSGRDARSSGATPRRARPRSDAEWRHRTRAPGRRRSRGVPCAPRPDVRSTPPPRAPPPRGSAKPRRKALIRRRAGRPPARFGLVGEPWRWIVRHQRGRPDLAVIAEATAEAGSASSSAPRPPG